MLYKIQVTDTRKKYPPRVYSVEASEPMVAYGHATEQYIRDNNHPPYKPGRQRISSYYSRFWNELIHTTH